VPQKKQNLEIDSLARKNLRDEDENEFHNRTQQNFRDFKKPHNNSKINLNISNLDDKKKKFFNFNKKIN
jgi:hypothetical protein